jgi:hypothetical protein
LPPADIFLLWTFGMLLTQNISKMNAITFENMPKMVADLNEKVDSIIRAMASNTPPETDKLMTLDELIDFLPEHPAKQTVYGWVNYRQIPFTKHGKYLYFRKSEIETWLNNGRKVK